MMIVGRMFMSPPEKDKIGSSKLRLLFYARELSKTRAIFFAQADRLQL
jgi:hypothetical protein